LEVKGILEPPNALRNKCPGGADRVPQITEEIAAVSAMHYHTLAIHCLPPAVKGHVKRLIFGHVPPRREERSSGITNARTSEFRAQRERCVKAFRYRGPVCLCAPAGFKSPVNSLGDVS